MNAREIILQELSAISKQIAAIPKVNVFSIPENYFNTLSTSILHKIQNDTLFAMGNKQLNVGEVPEGYFEGLAGQIMNKINAGENPVEKETREFSVTVAEIGNRNIFSVPEGYFQSLGEVINLRIPKPAKVVSMKKSSSFFNYAAAAVITGILGLSVFSVFNNKENLDNNIGQLPVIMTKAGEIIKNKTFDIELNNISDKEIEQYLIQNGQDVNAALVASVIDENNLPGTDEYLTDENTLDEFLNKLNLNN